MWRLALMAIHNHGFFPTTMWFFCVFLAVFVLQGYMKDASGKQMRGPTIPVAACVNRQ